VTIVKIILGAPSKYDDGIPYTYEARYRYIDGMEDYNSYFSDTICGLIRYLKQKGHGPESVELYEIYKSREISITPDLYTRDGNNWLTGSELCQSFSKIYPGLIGGNSCKFDDRSQVGLG